MHFAPTGVRQHIDLFIVVLYVMRLANALRGCDAHPPSPNCGEILMRPCCLSGLENVISGKQNFRKFISRKIDNTYSVVP